MGVPTVVLAILLIAPGLNQTRFAAQPSPDAAFAAYVEVLRQGVTSPDLALYAPETRAWLRDRRITRSMQRSELAVLEAAAPSRRVRDDGASRAVVCFPGHPEAPPYFLRRSAEGWTIDLMVMSRVIAFDRANRWAVRDPNSQFAFGLGGCV